MYYKRTDLAWSMPKAREMLEKEGEGGEYGGREESGEGPRGRRRAIPGRASWNASERIQTSRYWSASISRGLISSITESELGTYCTCSRHMRVRRSREREREREKIRSDPVLPYAHTWWNVSPSRFDGYREIERRAYPTPLTSDTGFDRSLCRTIDATGN